MNWDKVFAGKDLRSHEVRLFSLKKSGLEQRATEALLAVVKSVSEFADDILGEAKARKSRVDQVTCYTEVGFIPYFKDNKEDEGRPDGIIRIKWPSKDWVALVEVKIGENEIDEKQIEKYLRLARNEKFDAILSISNQQSLPKGGLPYNVKYLNKNTNVVIKHYSWRKLINIAETLLNKDNGVKDEDQRWILQEWLLFVADDRSNIVELPHFGNSWAIVRSAINQNNVRNCKDSLDDIVKNWVAFVRVVGFKLGAMIAENVDLKVTGKDTKKWYDELLKNACDSLLLSCELVVPNAPILIVTLDLRTSTIEISCILEKKWIQDGTQQKVLGQMRRQLGAIDKVDKNLLLSADWGRGLNAGAKCGEFIEKQEALLRVPSGERVPKDRKLKSFTIKKIIDFKAGKGGNTSKSLGDVKGDIIYFYRNIVQNLKRPSPKSPPPVKDNTSEDSIMGDYEG